MDRPNLLVKIPATREGLPAIRSAIAEGLSVNVTLILSVRVPVLAVRVVRVGVPDGCLADAEG